MTNQSEKGSSGNFADDPQKASEAGRKGGQHSHTDGSHSSTNAPHKNGGQQEQTDKSGGQQHGGSGNFKDNPEKASEAGRKGGQHSHGK